MSEKVGYSPDSRPASRLTRMAFAVACSALLGFSAPATSVAADPFLVVAEADATEPLPLPSVAAQFRSFEEVSKAVVDERARIAALESRLKELEQRAAAVTERLPAPAAA